MALDSDPGPEGQVVTLSCQPPTSVTGMGPVTMTSRTYTCNVQVAITGGTFYITAVSTEGVAQNSAFVNVR